jgi:hypothetical protein
MFRITASALLQALILSSAGCGDATPPDTALVSQAIAAPSQAPANTPPKGYQSSVSPTAVEDTVVEYE